MMKFGLVASAALVAGLVAGSAPANAATLIGTETFSGGFNGPLFPGTAYLVASDGEASFDPYGAGFDTSDGLNFSGVGFPWSQAADSHWTALGNQTWVLPAVIPGCGAENETTCEPAGHFVSPDAWSPGFTGTFVIGEWGPGDVDHVGGSYSDIIYLYNNAAGANVLFYSDFAGSGGVPEPSTWAMMLVGFAGLGFAGYRTKAKLALPAI
jgi:PEP-CTERM motif